MRSGGRYVATEAIPGYAVANHYKIPLRQCIQSGQIFECQVVYRGEALLVWEAARSPRNTADPHRAQWSKITDVRGKYKEANRKAWALRQKLPDPDAEEAK